MESLLQGRLSEKRSVSYRTKSRSNSRDRHYRRKRSLSPKSRIDKRQKMSDAAYEQSDNESMKSSKCFDIIDLSDTDDLKLPEGLKSPQRSPLPSAFVDALGSSAESKDKLGSPIHQEIASRFEDIALKGLGKDAMQEMEAKYKIPSNCTLIKAPTLNKELINSAQEFAKKRDKNLHLLQEKIATGLAALQTAIEGIMDCQLTDKPKLYQPLLDGAKIFADLQFDVSVNRRNLILGTLSTTVKNVLEKSEHGQLLFNEDLSLAIKSAKELEKVAKDLKKPVGDRPKPKISTVDKKDSRKPAQPLNYRGPSRTYQRRRGGNPRPHRRN